MALDTVALADEAALAAERASDVVRRLSGLLPRRAPLVRMGSVRQNNRLVYRAQDRTTGRTIELSPLAAEILVACDGRHNLADLARIAQSRLDLDDPRAAANDVLGVLSAAEANGLILPLERKPGGFAASATQSLLVRTLKNPLFARFSLFSPAPLFDRLLPLANALFSPVGFIVWLAIVGAGAALALANWSELTAHAADQGLAAHNLVWMLVLFPIVKVLHETGHGLACRRWGGEVRDFGISLMVFVPIPYVDCSDSAFFVQRRQRIIVAAAGMMVEFVLASLALCVWLVSTDEIVRVLAFNVLILTSITTVLFNANPLLRYDAYYILSELLGIDNLSTKAQALIGGWTKRAFLGDAAGELPSLPLHEAVVLLVYGVLSFCYRVFLVFVIITSLLPRFFLFGVILSAWAAIALIVLPLRKQLVTASASLEKLPPDARKRLVVRGGLLAIGVVALLAIPLPYAMVVDGHVRLPPDSLVRASEAGVVESLPQGLAGDVAAGDPLLNLGNPLLAAELRSNEATLVSQQRKHQALLASDLAQAALIAADLSVTEEDIADAELRVARLVIRAPAGGRFELAQDIRPGTYVEEGDRIGLVLDAAAPRLVTVLLAQEDADLVGSRLVGAAVRPVASPSRTRPATVRREYVVVQERPGPTPTAQPLVETRYGFELDVEDGADLPYGQAMKVRFDLGAAPLAVQLWRSATIWYEKLMLSRYINQGS